MIKQIRRYLLESEKDEFFSYEENGRKHKIKKNSKTNFRSYKKIIQKCFNFRCFFYEYYFGEVGEELVKELMSPKSKFNKSFI